MRDVKHTCDRAEQWQRDRLGGEENQDGMAEDGVRLREDEQHGFMLREYEQHGILLGENDPDGTLLRNNNPDQILLLEYVEDGLLLHAARKYQSERLSTLWIRAGRQ